MMRMKPAAPTLTFTICPINSTRSHALPLSNEPPKTFKTDEGAIMNRRRSGIVPPRVHLVMRLKSALSRSMRPRSYRSATNGLNM